MNRRQRLARFNERPPVVSRSSRPRRERYTLADMERAIDGCFDVGIEIGEMRGRKQLAETLKEISDRAEQRRTGVGSELADFVVEEVGDRLIEEVGWYLDGDPGGTHCGLPAGWLSIERPDGPLDRATVRQLLAEEDQTPSRAEQRRGKRRRTRGNPTT